MDFAQLLLDRAYIGVEPVVAEGAVECHRDRLLGVAWEPTVASVRIAVAFVSEASRLTSFREEPM